MATVQELRDALDQLIQLGHGDKELRMTYQSNYPLQDHVAGLWLKEEDYEGPDSDDEEDEEDDENGFVYIVSGGQDHRDPYGPRKAFDNNTLYF